MYKLFKILLSLILTYSYINANVVGSTKGEFSVNQGSANYSLPIELPKGVAGLKPNLAISYNSSNRMNGALGVGFSLNGLSQISKCNETLFVEKKDTSKDFNYCLDGQTLVLKNSLNSYGSNTEYKTEVDSYSKIEKDTLGWVVYAKDGLIYEYGKTSDSKDSGTFFRVNKISDRFNNQINFQYDTLSKAIKKITYANNSIDFIYENRTDIRELYSRDIKFDASKRLKTVSIKTNEIEVSSYGLNYEYFDNKSLIKNITECIDGKCLAPIAFNWNKVTPNTVGGSDYWFVETSSGLNKWNIFAQDMNGDNLPDLVQTYTGDSSGHRFRVSLNTGNGFESPRYWLSDTSASLRYWNLFAQDMNGDKLPDLVQTFKRGTTYSFKVALNTGNGFESSKYWFNDNSYSGSLTTDYSDSIENWNHYAQDINGDGLPDLIQVYKGKSGHILKVALNKGTGFESETYWFENYQYSLKDWNIFLQDMNKDGLVDLVQTYKGVEGHRFRVRLNTGKGFGSRKYWLKDNNSSLRNWDISTKDMNADGLPDLVQIYKGEEGHRFRVSLNTGNGFASVKYWLSDTNYSLEHWNIFAQDMNGDKLPDLVQTYKGKAGHRFRVALNTGNGFGSVKYWLSDTNYSLEHWNLFAQDMNMDGLSDIIQTYKGKAGHRFRVSLNKNALLQISSITNQKDQDIKIEYSDLKDSNIYTSNKNLNYPNVEVKASAMKVVKSFSSINGIGGYNKTSFKYKNYAFNLERGSLGFEEIEVFDNTTQTKVISIFNQTYPYIGTLKNSKTYVKNKLLAESFNYFTNISRGLYSQIYLNKKIEKNYDYITSNMLTTKTTINSYLDQYGNIGNISTVTTGNSQRFEKNIVNVYDNYESSWILSRLKSSSVTHKADGKVDITRKSSFEYYSDTGTLKKEIIEPSNIKALTKTYTYDSKGNKKTETISGYQIKPRTTTYDYDSNAINKTAITNALGHTEKRTYDIRNQLKTVTGPNNLTTTFTYDEMGRKTKELRADGTYVTWEYTWETIGHSVTQKLNGKFPTKVYFDKLGREIKKEKTGFDGRVIFEEFEYDKKGNKVKVSTPYFEGEYPEYINYIYDDVNRLIEVNSPAPHDQRAIDKIAYIPFSTIKTNAKNQTKTTTINAIEKVILVNDNNESSIRYEYDSIGNLKKTIDSKGNTISIDYDIFGNKTKQNDPDMGIWTYTYNSLGKLHSQKDAKGQITTFIYDEIGRVLKKVTPEGTIAFTYDSAIGKGIGKIHKELGIGNTKVYTYDQLGRVNKLTTTIDQIEYTKQFVYDSLGRVVKTIEPNSVEIKNNYNEHGYLESVTTPRRNAGEVDVNRLRSEISYDMEQYLANKKIAINYKAQLAKYKKDLARYQDIIELYKNNPNKAYIVNQLINHVTELEDLITALDALAKSYDEKTNQFYDATFNEMLNSSQSLELASLYETFKYDLVHIAKYSLSLLEELKEKKEENKKLLYCGTVGGIIIFCPDEMTHTDMGNYTKDDNILFYGTNAEILAYYEKALADLTKDVNYIKTVEEKIAYYEHLGNTYQYKQGAYQEILESNEIYFYKVIEQNSLGITTSYLSGNGLETRNEYDQRGILYSINTGYDSDDSRVRESTYTYDVLNNVTNRNDLKLQVEQDFIYDSLNRLKYANITTKDNLTTLSYDYDELGNMIYKSDIGYYEYTSNRPHAVTKIGSKSFVYDENGNMINNDGKIITYSSFNKPTKIQTVNSTVTFSYDTNNSRYKKTSNSNTTHYVNKTFERHYTGGVTEDKYLIYVGNQLVSTFSNKDSQYSVNFLHYDNLGSIDTITNHLGEVVERFSYKPFGERLKLDINGNEIIQTPSSITNRGYTGHEHIEEAGLIHMNGRVYDPTIARFLSADPNIFHPFDSQNFNRYSYTMNNPLKYTDPSGFDVGFGGHNVGGSEYGENPADFGGSSGNGNSIASDEARNIQDAYDNRAVRNDGWQRDPIIHTIEKVGYVVGYITHNIYTGDHYGNLNSGASFGNIYGTTFLGDSKRNFIGSYNNGKGVFGVKSNGDYEVFYDGIKHAKTTGTFLGLDYKVEYSIDLVAHANSLRIGANTLNLIGGYMLTNPVTAPVGLKVSVLGLGANAFAERFSPTSVSNSIRNSLLDIMATSLGVRGTFTIEVYKTMLDHYAGD